jgi:uncharacterized protein YjbJ (UPF0337 family)
VKLSANAGKISDHDLTEAEGKLAKSIGKIEERSGERRQALEKWLDSQSMLNTTARTDSSIARKNKQSCRHLKDAIHVFCK